MQLNGTSGTTMAASEPPEPPPRNPDRINASLIKLSDSKTTKSLDTNDKPVNNNKPLKPILSLDNAISPSGTSSSVVLGVAATASSLGGVGGSNSSSSSGIGGGGGGISPLSTSTAANSKRIDMNNQNNTIGSLGLSPGSNGIVGTSPIIDNNQQQRTISSNNKMDKNNRLSSISIDGQTVGGGTATTNDILNGINHKAMTKGPNQGSTVVVNNGPFLSSTKDANMKGNHADVTDNNGGGDGGGTGGANNCDGNRNDDSRCGDNTESKEQAVKLRQENERLTAEIARLRKVLENSPDGAVGGIDLSDSNSYEAHSTDGGTGGGGGSGGFSRIERLELELKSVKSQVITLRTEKKKLKSDKTDLLAHVKQLCSSLQDKEQELRDFIRNYEQKIRENETNNAKLTSERERERWSLLKHARDEAERSLALAQQLNARDLQLQRAQEQLHEARRQLSGCLSDQESLLSFAPLTPPSGLMAHLAANTNSLSAFGGDRGSCSADSGLRGSSDRESAAGDLNLSDGTCENGPCITVDPDSISIVSSQHMYQYGTPKERSPTLSPLNSGAYSSRSVEQLGSPVDQDGPSALSRKFISKAGPATGTGTLGTRTGRGGTWGSISRVFARSRNKHKALSSDAASELDFSWSPLSEEGYGEKLRLLREASQVPIERWRASQVLAWLEVALGMPQYSSRCTENVKSGKVLLELNDTELETGLGLAHPMHRKKLRLAIEEQRRPDLVRYPSITQLGHTWVASEWLPDIGLPQYAESFMHSLVDARMLDTLSKKELEKFLGVTRKFHQASIVHGIHVLRIVKYDRQTLAVRRLQSESVDSDPIVWTNQRFIRWAKSIDLSEYADNLKDSGVHGGLVVLEPSFSGDTMATALGIPQSKNIIRRHLTTEFDALILPARATLGQGIRSGCGVVPITGPGGLQQHYATTDRRSSGSLRISAWKGSQSSLSKAFRFNTKPRGYGEKVLGNSTSPTPSYSSSESGGIYATIGPPLLPPPTTAPPPPPPSHRVSAPPAGAQESTEASILGYGPHRRVKSISDIEVVATSSAGSPA